jgi:hypothetical protein
MCFFPLLFYLFIYYDKFDIRPLGKNKVVSEHVVFVSVIVIYSQSYDDYILVLCIKMFIYV